MRVWRTAKIEHFHFRKPLLCKPHSISSSAHSHSQFAQIINRHNRSPQQYFIVPVAAIDDGIKTLYLLGTDIDRASKDIHNEHGLDYTILEGVE